MTLLRCVLSILVLHRYTIGEKNPISIYQNTWTIVKSYQFPVIISLNSIIALDKFVLSLLSYQTRFA